MYGQNITAKTPEEYIANLEEPRKSQIQKVHDLIVKTVPKLKPFIMAGMIGYGAYHYKYATGREGDWSYFALASNKAYISFYVMCIIGKEYAAESYKDKLPKASVGKSCIRYKKFEDMEEEFPVLVELMKEAEILMPKMLGYVSGK